MLTTAGIRNTTRVSGYDHVGYNVQHGQPEPPKPYQAVVYGGKRSKAGMRWIGPRRATALEAAQDYCDYMNGNAIAPTPALKTAGHVTKRPQRSQHPKRIEGRRLIREARADEDTAHPEGYVYLVGEENLRAADLRFGGVAFQGRAAVKTGKSADHPEYRLAGLQTGNPRKLVLLGYLAVPDRHTAETELHARYAHANILQEWFRPTSALMAEFGLLADGSERSPSARAAKLVA